MNNLILSVLSSASLLIFFKVFEKYKINSEIAISANYVVASLLGYMFLTDGIVYVENASEWLPISIFLGVLFLVIFVLCKFSAQNIGIGITSVSMKLGVVFPVMLGIILYNESFSFLNYLGLGLGFISIYLINKPSKSIDSEVNKWILLLPIFIWIGSGLGDSIIQYIERSFKVPVENGMFSFSIFSAAAASSITFNIYQREKPDLKSIIGGLALGIPNYFSIFFLVKAITDMKSDYKMNSANIFMINNLSVIICTVAIGFFIFQERLGRWNYFGILIALTSLFLINYK